MGREGAYSTKRNQFDSIFNPTKKTCTIKHKVNITGGPNGPFSLSWRYEFKLVDSAETDFTPTKANGITKKTCLNMINNPNDRLHISSNLNLSSELPCSAIGNYPRDPFCNDNEYCEAAMYHCKVLF
jgi:hypothetical protein